MDKLPNRFFWQVARAQTKGIAKSLFGRNGLQRLKGDSHA